jgi:hypothetical protein
MGTALCKLVTRYKGKQLIRTGDETTERRGITGKGSLTTRDIDKIQKYYGKAIPDNPGNIEGMTKSIKAAFGHYSNDHQFCPHGETWCKFQCNDPASKDKAIAPGVMKLVEPVLTTLQSLIS